MAQYILSDKRCCRMRLVLMVFGILLLLGCNKDCIRKEKKLDNTASSIEVCKIKGTVRVRDGNCNKFLIKTYLTVSGHSTLLAIPQELPEEFRKDGLEVKYSGVLTKMDSFSCSWTAGEVQFDLELSCIKTR